MGRKRKYYTEVEKKEAQLKWQREHYERNKKRQEKRREHIIMPKRKKKGVKICMESKLLLGDSKDKLKDFQNNSVDLIATDPPYGYGFMGKSWDQVLPDKNIFKECLRVLKPGGFAFVMSAPRSDVQ